MRFVHLAMSVGLVASWFSLGQTQAQTSVQTAALTSLAQVFSHAVVMREAAATCSAVAPDQSGVFKDAYALWSQRNANELMFVTDAIKTYFANRAGEQTSFENSNSQSAKTDVKAAYSNQASCTQWLVQVTSSRSLDFNVKLPEPMKALEARFVKAS
jgi:hypothetical protein